MKIAKAMAIGISATAVAALAISLRAGTFPLGVPGEWEWPRSPGAPLPMDLLLAGCGVLAYAAFAATGYRALRTATPARETRWLAALCVAAVAVQVAIFSGAPLALGLTKWVSLAIKGSSGYYHLARSPEMADPWRFWAAYPGWIRDQDALHVGTHPPGLFLAWRGVLAAMDRFPGVSRALLDWLPISVDQGFRSLLPTPLPVADRAAVAFMGMLTLMACALTVLPLYRLARQELPAPSAWFAAVLWPLAPSAVMFQPTADTAFPLLATSVLALTAKGGPLRATVAGVILGVGLQFSLAFLPVGLASAILLGGREGTMRERLARLGATGLGFLAVTLALWGISGANPWVIWWWNQRNHSRFYAEFPRTYRAWVVVNPIELAVAIGLPSALLATIGFVSRAAPRSAWAGLLVLVILNLSGKNLSEVARLWLPFMPCLLVAAGASVERLQGGPAFLGAIAAIVGAQTLALQATIQVVYPVMR